MLLVSSTTTTTTTLVGSLPLSSSSSRLRLLRLLFPLLGLDCPIVTLLSLFLFLSPLSFSYCSLESSSSSSFLESATSLSSFSSASLFSSSSSSPPPLHHPRRFSRESFHDSSNVSSLSSASWYSKRERWGGGVSRTK